MKYHNIFCCTIIVTQGFPSQFFKQCLQFKLNCLKSCLLDHLYNSHFDFEYNHVHNNSNNPTQNFKSLSLHFKPEILNPNLKL